jgi:hypothetical protein
MKFNNKQLTELYNTGKSGIFKVVEIDKENDADFPIPATRAWGYMVFKNGIDTYKVGFSERCRHHNTDQLLTFTKGKRVKKVKKVIEYEEWEEI